MLKAQKVRQVKSLNLQFEAPLENFKYTTLGYALTLYYQFKDHGTMPFIGTLSDQPAQIIEIFNTLASLERESEESMRKEAEREAKRKQSVRR